MLGVMSTIHDKRGVGVNIDDINYRAFFGMQDVV